MKTDFFREYFSIPNIMGYFRIILALLYILVYYMTLEGAPYWPVIAIIVLSGLRIFWMEKLPEGFIW